MIQNIIFDMGNVLMDFDPEYALNKYLDNDADRALIRKELFKGPEWIMADAGKITNAERFEPVSKRVPARLHPALFEIISHWNDCMVPLEGAQAFCDSLREKGYHIYVLSNADDTFYDYFPRFKPLSWFDGVMVSSTVKMIKPDPAIFQHLLKTFDLQAENCLFIDDNADNIAAAKALGFHGFWFKGSYDEIARTENL